MTDTIPSIVSHVSLGTNDVSVALPFYDAIMDTVGATRKEVIDLDDIGVVAVAYGKEFPQFWIQLPDSQQPASVGNGVHVGFIATDE